MVLDGTGAVLWEALSRPRQIDELCAELAQSFGVPVEVVVVDVRAFVDDLVERDLLMSTEP